MMSRDVFRVIGIVGAGIAFSCAATTARAQLLFSENFDSLPLMDSVNERLGFPHVTRVATDPNSAPIPASFSKTGPAGWSIDNTLGTFNGSPTVGNSGVAGAGVADFGVDEWE